MTLLRISRDSGFADRTRNYQVIVNSDNLGDIGNGKTKEFEIDSNDAEVYLAIDWCRSNKLNIEASGDRVIHLFAKSSLRGFKIFLALFYVTMKPTEYIRLSQVHG